MVDILLQMGVHNRLDGRERSCRHYNFANRGIMRNNYRRKIKKTSQVKTFEQLTIQDFEAFCAMQLDDMINADKYNPGIDNYGVKPFSAIGLRDQGYGVVVRCKDGSSFVMSIKPLDEFNKLDS